MKSLWYTWLHFVLLTDPTIRYGTLGLLILTSSAAVMGVFSLLQKRALAGDAIAHGVLPGLCIAFLITGTQNTLYLTLGAVLSGWLSLFVMERLPRISKLKPDTATALVLAVFFGFGTLLLTHIQHTGNAAQAGLQHFLFGKTAAMMRHEVILLGSMSIGIMLLVWLFFRPLQVLVFDPHFAQSIGLPVNKLNFLLRCLTLLAIVVGIQAVGIVLMAAILVAPAAAARFWTPRLHVMLWLSVAFGLLASLAGGFVSYIAPKMPTGPWVVLMLGLIALFSFTMAPHQGAWARWRKANRHRKKMLRENILKCMYEAPQAKVSYSYLQARLVSPLLPKILSQLVHHGLVQTHGRTAFSLTATGQQTGARIDKLHRLWECYLTHYLGLRPDFVHNDAESMEHVLTPALESELERLLGDTFQVHGSKEH